AIHHALQQPPVSRPQGILFQQNLAQRLCLVEDPSVHRVDERVPSDETHLQGKDAEETVAVGSGSVGGRIGHWAPLFPTSEMCGTKAHQLYPSVLAIIN